MRGLCHLAAANQHLVSPLLFAAFLSNFFLNLHLVSSLFFLSATMTPFDRTLVIALVALQALFALVPRRAMVRLDTDLLSPGRLFGQVQPVLVLVPLMLRRSADKVDDEKGRNGERKKGEGGGVNMNMSGWRRDAALFSRSNRELIGAKLKALALFEQLYSDTAYRFTVGSLGAITNKSVYEVGRKKCLLKKEDFLSLFLYNFFLFFWLNFTHPIFLVF